MRKLTISTKYIAKISRLSMRKLMVGEARRKGIKEFGVRVKTVLLRDIFDDEGSYISSHQWIDNEYGFTDEDVGKTIEFSATIVPYIKHVNHNLTRDFKLGKISDIVKGD